MGDYNLSGLNNRDFEHLTQALAMAVVAAGVTPFGDGPDGGREATYTGKMMYPSSSDVWDGYLVIQSKFRTRPANEAESDGDWVLDQLKSELHKFENPKRNLPKPEYYIFVTNVVLTPVQDKGSKDKAFKLLEEQKASIGMKDYDIWDFDKLCRLIDTQESIRNRYAAFITAGDVLAKMIEVLGDQESNFDQTLSRFLQKELLSDQFVKLEQAGHNAEHKTLLAQVFVDLPVSLQPINEPPEDERTSRGPIQGVVAEILEGGSQILKRSVFEKETHVSGGKIGQACEPGRYVVIGGPGQGKSTIGQFICQLYRAAILKDRPRSTLALEALTTLDLFTEQCSADRTNLPVIRRFPIRVVLDQFATELASNKVRSLLGYILERINHRTDTKCSMEELRRWLAKYPWLIVLDGLDEVPATSNRQQVLDKITDFWMEVATTDADVLVVATTRPQGYNHEFSPQFYNHRYLVPLSRSRALQYAHRLVEAQYGTEQDRRERVLRRLQIACDQETTRRLMRSPLQVTIMATLVDRIGQPPQERWRLFQQYYEVIYQREMEREIPASQILQQRKADVNAIHYRVGLLLQTESEKAGKTESKLLSDRFYQLVRARIAAEGHEGEQLTTRTQEITDAALQRLVFLVGLQEDRIGFEIRSLQEFMAAEALMDGKEEQVRARLEAIAPIVHWRNVFLFAVGKCFADRQFLRDMIIGICEQLNDAESDQLAGVTLSGSRLALDILADGVAREQPRYARSLGRLALRLLEIQDMEACARLGSIYEPLFEQLFREQLGQRFVLRDASQKVSAWAVLLALTEQRVGWAIDLAEANWPTDVAQQEEILLRRGGYILGEWAANKLIQLIPNISPVQLPSFLWHSNHNIYRSMSVPNWFQVILNFLTPPFGLDEHGLFNVPLLPGKDSKGRIMLRMRSVADSSLGKFASLKHLPFTNSNWAPFVSAARFAEQPNSDVLARELRWLSTIWDVANSKVSMFDFAWPFAACLAACNTKADLIRLAEKLEKGLLGSTDDWIEAERRWQNKGVTEEDIEYINDYNHWPYDEAIRSVGFPLSGSDISADGSSNNRLANWNTLWSSYTALPEGQAKFHIAMFTITFLNLYGFSDHRTRMQVTPKQMKQLAEHAMNCRERPYFSGGIEVPRKLNEEWIELFEWLGNKEVVFFLGERNKALVEQLSKAYIANSERLGILRTLRYLVSLNYKPHIPEDLLVDSRFEDHETRTLALQIRLAKGDWSVPRIKRLVKLIAELYPINNRVVSQSLYIFREDTFITLGIERFLLALREELVSMQSLNDMPDITALLRARMDVRVSQLGKKQCWAALGLPDLT